MTSDIPDLNFGPSERYLPGKKLLEGDVLTLNILDFEKDEVDTEYGSKLQFHLNILSSSTDVVKPGKYIWRTVTAAARKVHKYYTDAPDVDIAEFSHWVWKFTVMENGVKLQTLNSVSVQSGDTTKHGTPALGNTTAGDGND
jgi:hypothetical protein